MKIKVSKMGLVGNKDDHNINNRSSICGGVDDYYEAKLSNDGGGDDSVDDKIEDQRLAHDPSIYWESQQFLLQEILDQYKSNGSKLREEIKRHVNIARDSTFCSCVDKNISVSGCCIKCLRLALIDHLCSKGFSAALCTSKWQRTHHMPGGNQLLKVPYHLLSRKRNRSKRCTTSAGTHEYIEVIATTEGRKKQIPFLIELGFCDEFRMAKACDEYHRMINLLPEIYIGKADHMNAIIRLVCEAAKKSSVEQKIHMGPWRKRGFMQMKWSASKEKKLAS